jgi:hypothetical protein
MQTQIEQPYSTEMLESCLFPFRPPTFASGMHSVCPDMVAIMHYPSSINLHLSCTRKLHVRIVGFTYVDHLRKKLQTSSFLLVLHQHSIVHMIPLGRVRPKASLNSEEDTSVVLSFCHNATQSTMITE